MADIDSLTVDYAECPLHWLVGVNRYFPHVQARLEVPNQTHVKCNDLLLAAAMSQMTNWRIVTLLLLRGADVNSLNASENTPLHLAVCSRNTINVKVLIEYGAYVKARDLEGRTPLHFAVCEGSSRCVSPFIISFCYNAIVERLLSHPDIYVNLADSKGDTPLMWAVKEQNIKAVKALLKKGADPNLPNRFNTTPLHEAFYPPLLSSFKKSSLIALELLDNGAGIYCLSKYGHTPMDNLLSIAVRSESMLRSAAVCLKKIVLRFQIKQDLRRKLKRIPYLYDCLNKCCKEVALMKRLVISEHGNLHDYALGWFPMQHKDVVDEVYIPVVELLMAFSFPIYHKSILKHLRRSGLSKLLKRLHNDFELQPNHTKRYLYAVIQHLYHITPGLGLRLEELKMRYAFN